MGKAKIFGSLIHRQQDKDNGAMKSYIRKLTYDVECQAIDGRKLPDFVKIALQDKACRWSNCVKFAKVLVKEFADCVGEIYCDRCFKLVHQGGDLASHSQYDLIK